MSTAAIAGIVIAVIIVIIILAASIKVFPEYQRGVIFRLGRLDASEGTRPLLHHPHRR